jgi:hypothetical protein
MDSDTLLVECLLGDGQKLVEKLPRRGFDVTTAFWIKPTADGQWYFYIVAPAVESEGILQAYTRLIPLIRQMPQPFRIDPLEVKLIGPSEPLAQDVLAAHRRAPGPREGPFHWPDIWLGNMSVEGV